jgi:outer membrane protein assembly factor BamB
MRQREVRHGGSGAVVVGVVVLTALLVGGGGVHGMRASAAVPVSTVQTTTTPDWSSYLFAADHAGYNPLATAITTANAASLVKVWHWAPGAPGAGELGGLYSSPVVSGGMVFIGARTGVFYAINETTGKLVWKRTFAPILGTTCGPQGFTSTATVAPDPTSGDPTVYVASPDGYLYALNAATGETVWSSVVAIPSKKVNDYYNWASPTLSGGVVYMGISSECDMPLVRGGVIAVDQASGARLATYYSVPAGEIGASVWGSVLVTDSGQVFAGTGNGPADSQQESIVRLVLDPVAGTLTQVDQWEVPASEQATADSDFGTSPTEFVADVAGVPTDMVGACNKGGWYYALQAADLAAGPLWSFKAGDAYRFGFGQCDASAIWDGSRLFVASNSTTIGGVPVRGSVREVNPSTGTVLWATGLPGPAIGSPTLDAAGVLAIGVYGGKTGPFLLNGSTGALLKTLAVGNGKSFGQSIFTDSGLLLATTQTSGITALKAP